MPKLTGDQPTTAGPKHNRAAWRIANSVIILFSFFPWWFPDFRYEPTDGIMALIASGQNILLWVTGRVPVFWYSEYDFEYNAGNFVVFLGLIVTLIYCALNLYAAFPSASLTDNSGWRVLVICLRAITVIAFVFGILLHLGVYYWAYWLFCLGLVSSIWLEFMVSHSKKAAHVG